MKKGAFFKKHRVGLLNRQKQAFIEKKNKDACMWLVANMLPMESSNKNLCWYLQKFSEDRASNKNAWFNQITAVT